MPIFPITKVEYDYYYYYYYWNYYCYCFLMDKGSFHEKKWCEIFMAIYIKLFQTSWKSTSRTHICLDVCIYVSMCVCASFQTFKRTYISKMHQLIMLSLGTDWSTIYSPLFAFSLRKLCFPQNFYFKKSISKYSE